MSAPASNLSSSLPISSSQSSLLASRSSASQLQLSTSSLPARSTSPAAVHSGSPSSEESLSSDWHNDESPPDDVHGANDDTSVFDSLTDSQFITHEQAAEAAAAIHASAATLPRPSAATGGTAVPASAAPSSSSVSAAPSEDSAALGTSDPHTDSSWLSAIRDVQKKEKAEAKDADSKEESERQQSVEEMKASEEKEAGAPLAAAGQVNAAEASDSGNSCVPVVPSRTLYSRVSSLLSSFSSSPVLPGALLSISLLAVGFCLGRAWQRRQYSLAAQQHADAVCTYLSQQHRSSNMSSRPFSRGGTGTGPTSGGSGLVDSTRRLVSAILGEQEKEIGRWLGLLQDGVLTPVMVRYIQ